MLIRIHQSTTHWRFVAALTLFAIACLTPALFGIPEGPDRRADVQPPQNDAPQNAENNAPAPGQDSRAGQDAQGRPTDRAGQAEEDEQTQPFTAFVIEVQGSVEWAAPDVSVLEADGWTPVKVGDRLEPGTQLRTGLRSFVNLQFGETTVAALRSATHASIDQLYRTATMEHVRIGLGYGTVRGGAIEGVMRSDVVVDSPVATLAKRGTEGWEMQVEAMTGRFRISLAREGLVEALQKARSAGRTSRTVRPGEYATDADIANMWIQQDIFDREVQFFQEEGLTLADAQFNALNRTGVSVVTAGGGSALSAAARPAARDFVLQQISLNFPQAGLPPTTLVVPTGPVRRPEGNFGTGQTFRVLFGR